MANFHTKHKCALLTHNELMGRIHFWPPTLYSFYRNVSNSRIWHVVLRGMKEYEAVCIKTSPFWGHGSSLLSRERREKLVPIHLEQSPS